MVMKEKLSKFMDINRIEFIVTFQCGGRCRHCQIGNDINKRGPHRHVLSDYAVEAVKKIASVYNVDSIMTFGGEPLYYPEVTAAIHKAATDCKIETRQIITNGYFTNSTGKSGIVANALADAGVNNLLLSVDAFHQEHIPFEPVYQFARDIVDSKIPGAKLYPAWLVNSEHQNPYNMKTKEILARFSNLSVDINEYENQVSPLGRATNLLREYYEKAELNITKHECSELLTVTNISIVPNGDFMVCGFVIGNIYEEDVLDIIAHYNPYQNEGMLAIIQDGVVGLLDYAKTQGVVISASDYCDVCGLCEAVVKKVKTQLHI
jgi:hypothetical protein